MRPISDQDDIKMITRDNKIIYQRGGKNHRDPAQGPAVITHYPYGRGLGDDFIGQGDIILEEYMTDGVHHRDPAQGPAVIYKTAHGLVLREAYWQNGKRHRDPTQGPAVWQKTRYNGVIEEYWVDNVKCDKPLTKSAAWSLAAGLSPSASPINIVDADSDSDAESDFTDVHIDTTGIMTFAKVIEIILAKYLQLTMENPDCSAAAKLFEFYLEIKHLARDICESGYVPEYNIAKHNFITIYNIYIAKISSAIPIKDSHIDTLVTAIQRRKNILTKFHEYGVGKDGFLD
jgi:hypothetical protein